MATPEQYGVPVTPGMEGSADFALPGSNRPGMFSGGGMFPDTTSIILGQHTMSIMGARKTLGVTMPGTFFRNPLAAFQPALSAIPFGFRHLAMGQQGMREFALLGQQRSALNPLNWLGKATTLPGRAVLGAMDILSAGEWNKSWDANLGVSRGVGRRFSERGLLGAFKKGGFKYRDNPLMNEIRGKISSAFDTANTRMMSDARARSKFLGGRMALLKKVYGVRKGWYDAWSGREGSRSIQFATQDSATRYQGLLSNLNSEKQEIKAMKRLGSQYAFGSDYIESAMGAFDEKNLRGLTRIRPRLLSRGRMGVNIFGASSEGAVKRYMSKGRAPTEVAEVIRPTIFGKKVEVGKGFWGRVPGVRGRYVGGLVSKGYWKNVAGKATWAGTLLAAGGLAISGVEFATRKVGEQVEKLRQIGRLEMGGPGTVLSLGTGQAITERRRALEEIARSRLNARSLIGNEARMQHDRSL